MKIALLLLAFFAGHPQDAVKCRHCKDAGWVQCGKHKKAALEVEGPALRCSDLIDCRHCGGTLKILDSSKPRLSLGREDGNDIVLHVETASRQHGEVQLRDGWFYYVDHSWNGTFIYDEDGTEHLVHHGEYRLRESGFICPGCPGDAEEVMPLRYKIK